MATDREESSSTAEKIGPYRLLEPLGCDEAVSLARKTSPRALSVALLKPTSQQPANTRHFEAVLGERELAVSMMGYTLRSLGLPENEAREVVLGFRTSNDGITAFDHRLDPELEGTPELRP